MKKVKEKKGIFIINDDSKGSYTVTEKFKGEVLDKNTTFPKDLGAVHPFDFDRADEVYKGYGLIAGGVNKITDAIVSDFTIKLDNPNAQAIIDDFVHTTNFSTNVRTWVREGVLKGNGFMELDLDNIKIRVMNANNMYVLRDESGEIKKYNQYIGDLKNYNRKKVIEFKPNQIAHLTINKIPNDPYGIGFVFPNLKTITNIVNSNEDIHTIQKRKAGMPIHIKIGMPGESVSEEVVNAAKSDLQFLNNKHEWVTDGNVEIKSIDFRDLAKNNLDVVKNDYQELIAGMEIPEVLWGSGQLNEGIAKVQMDGWGRKIKSLQEQVESVIEEKIIRPLLNANGFDELPQFIWNLPSDDEINNRLERVTLLLNNPFLDEQLRQALQIEVARLLDMPELVQSMKSPEQAEADKEAEREEEEEIPQPEVPGAKPNANETHSKMNGSVINHTHMQGCGCGQQLTESQTREMTVKEFINLKEIPGFNYLDYITKIIKVTNDDNFAELLAKTKIDIQNGKLPQKEIDKLRIVLRNGFRENQTIRQIEKEIKDNIELTDRITDTGVVISKEVRPNMIARTETVRLANEGLKSLYKENKIESVRFLSALSDRTCPICEQLNGQMFKMDELNVGVNQPPIHTSCRCSLIGVVE